jgi:hypothetical protein
MMGLPEMGEMYVLANLTRDSEMSKETTRRALYACATAYSEQISSEATHGTDKTNRTTTTAVSEAL